MDKKFRELDKVRVVGGRNAGKVGVITKIMKWHDRYGYVVENHYHKPSKLGTYHACNIRMISTDEFLGCVCK